MPSNKRNRAYHNFFEGYTEYEQMDAKGKPKIHRVYTGLYYKYELTTAQKVCIRLFYILLFVISVGAYIFAATMDSPGNLVWYTNVPVAFSLILYIWLLVAICYYMPLRDRTVFEFRTSSLNAMRVCKWQIICVGVTIATHVLFIILNRPADTSREILVMVGYFITGAACFGIWFTEDHLPYSTYPSTQEPPAGVVIM